MPTNRNSSHGKVTPRSAPRTHGSSLRELGSPLDQERAASMADEGGVSGAETDALVQTSALAKRSDALVTTRTLKTVRNVLPWALLASGIVGGLAIAAYFWRRAH